MAKYLELVGQRVLVTGAASGIGEATVRRFLQEGSLVAALDWDGEGLERLCQECPEVLPLRANVADASEVDRAFKELDAAWGGLDVLVSNAGISLRHAFLDITLEEWERVLSVNLTGMFLLSQRALARMVPHQRGRILMTASTNGYRGHPYYADYNASKAGVILLMKTIAAEYAPHIRANAVCPGYVLTPMQQREYTPEMLDVVNASLPLKRHATPKEVAGMFLFLASDEADYLTGQCFTIDGGETI